MKTFLHHNDDTCTCKSISSIPDTPFIQVFGLNLVYVIHASIVQICKWCVHWISPHPDSPWPALLRPWSSSLPQTPSYVDEAVGWVLSGSWWRNKARRLQGWWGSEARCSHPLPPPYGRLALAPTGPQSGDQWIQEVVVRKSKILSRDSRLLPWTDRHWTHAVNKANLKSNKEKCDKNVWSLVPWLIYSRTPVKEWSFVSFFRLNCTTVHHLHYVI